MNDYCTPEEYSEKLGIGRTLVFALIKKGLPSIKIGRLRRILIEQADAWILAGGADSTRKRQIRAKRE
jgi:excisionase family DNA binding protein